MTWYALEVDGRPVPCTRREWAEARKTWINGDENPWRVAHTDLEGGGCVSTVFYGLNLQHGPKGPDLWYETRLFCDGHPLDHERRRWSTRAEAEAGHRSIVELAMETRS